MHNALCIIVFFCILPSLNSVDIKSQFTDKLIFKVHEDDFNRVAKELSQSYDFLYKIVPGIYVYEQKGLAGHELTKAEIDNLRRKFQVEDVEQVRRMSLQPTAEAICLSALPPSDEVTEFGMGIQQARSKGYTGETVTVGVLDAGACTDNLFLKDRISEKLSWNFIGNSPNVTPDWNPDYVETFPFSDHGTNMCGMVSSSGGCGGGVAQGSRLSVLKVVRVDTTCSQMTCMDEDHYAQGLAFRPEDIHIYASGLIISDSPFTDVSIAIKATIENGILKGRRGKGSIYVYPAGNVGNGLVNNPYTVSINGIGVNGTVPSFATPSATVLTSALAEGSTLESKLMSTTSCRRWRNCTAFCGLSPATAITAAITTFALQNNAALTYRDVFHIIVQASEHEHLGSESSNFKTNAAGKRFHSVFGFGQLNAEKVGSLAFNWTLVDRLVAITQMLSDRHAECKNNKCSIKVHVACTETSACVRFLEQVLVTVTLTTTSMENCRLYIESPGGTRSVLFYRGQSNEGTVNNFELRSVHFWDEPSIGDWTINFEIESQVSETLTLSVSSMTWYGTGNEAPVPNPPEPIKNQRGGFSFGAFAAILYPIVVFSATGCFLNCGIIRGW